jgi:ribosomal protein L6P/L9E
MACNITTGRAKACKEFLGGVQSLFLFNFVENAFTVTAGEATAINPLLTEVFEYKVEGDGQTLVENMVSDRNTGTTVNTQTITAMLKGIDADTSAELNLVAKGYPMAVVKDRNGVYHAVGLDDGIDFTIDQATGGAKTDMNGYTLTGVSTTGSLSPKLDSATITAFLALVD